MSVYLVSVGSVKRHWRQVPRHYPTIRMSYNTDWRLRNGNMSHTLCYLWPVEAIIPLPATVSPYLPDVRKWVSSTESPRGKRKFKLILADKIRNIIGSLIVSQFLCIQRWCDGNGGSHNEANQIELIRSPITNMNCIQIYIIRHTMCLPSVRIWSVTRRVANNPWRAGVEIRSGSANRKRTEVSKSSEQPKSADSIWVAA